MHDTQEKATIEHSELIDMRTHLTVAMLAAAQLNRRTKELPEAAHLQCYLDQSLKSLVEDVVKVDALVAQVDTSVPVATDNAPCTFPKPVKWAFGLVKRGVSGFCAWAHRRRYARLTALYLYR
jgi:hypothetical protein